MALNPQLAQLPKPLQSEVQRSWEIYLDNASSTDQQQLTEHSEIWDSLPKVWGCSVFVAKLCEQFPTLLSDLIRTGDLTRAIPDYTQQLTAQQAEMDSETALMKLLREVRRREMLRIAWRDIAGWAPLEETFKNLSQLADVLIDTALTFAYQALCRQWGVPYDRAGQQQQLIVLAMGKLGGQELNFSSDIDLIFAYPSQGETHHPERPRSNQEFFIRVSQKLIHLLNHITAEGFVFRVDMRLRPFGESGPMVMHFDALEDYYASHAREWERYALIKARVAAGDKTAGKTLMNLLQPFVYRRYLDFNAFEALRDMKALIDREAQRKGLDNNIKLGRGGIREIEFICQAFQLIRGGRQPELQERHLLKTLDLLKYQSLSLEAVKELKAAYQFLRMTENHLQAIADRQTQTLPTDTLNQTRLAYSLDFKHWDDFITCLNQYQADVMQHFETVIVPAPAVSDSSQLHNLQTLWLQGENDTATQSTLQKIGFSNPTLVAERLQKLLSAHAVKKMAQRDRNRLDKLIPLLLNIFTQQVGSETFTAEQRDKALLHILDLIEAVAQRSAYLALLIERPQVLEHLIQLCANSDWLANQIIRYPLLLDELIDSRELYDYSPHQPQALDNALQAQLAHLPADDLEMLMDSMRQFKRVHVLRVAAAELSGNLNVEVTSDYLATIADVLVKHSLSIACDYLSQRHGLPQCEENGEMRNAGFCIVAYGKAGGIELSYGSDLDIVFLHDSQGNQQVTDGEKPLDNQVFFIRLAQRVMHILSTNTAAGFLYEVDPRLRPGGASGLLVSGLTRFADYQKTEAWTWEHQALIRARAIAGDTQCMERFETIRREVLSQPRDPVKVREAVVEMRAKMQANLDKSTRQQFDIKQGTGGITDIEFIIQYGVLCWAAEHPELLTTTGMLPLLERYARLQLLPASVCEALGNAYRAYRHTTHQLALQNQPALAPIAQFAEVRQQVTHHWQTVMLA